LLIRVQAVLKRVLGIGIQFHTQMQRLGENVDHAGCSSAMRTHAHLGQSVSRPLPRRRQPGGTGVPLHDGRWSHGGPRRAPLVTPFVPPSPARMA
jgi:hypothetical protein